MCDVCVCVAGECVSHICKCCVCVYALVCACVYECDSLWCLSFLVCVCCVCVCVCVWCACVCELCLE